MAAALGFLLQRRVSVDDIVSWLVLPSSEPPWSDASTTERTPLDRASFVPAFVNYVHSQANALIISSLVSADAGSSSASGGATLGTCDSSSAAESKSHSVSACSTPFSAESRGNGDGRVSSPVQLGSKKPLVSVCAEEPSPTPSLLDGRGGSRYRSPAASLHVAAPKPTMQTRRDAGSGRRSDMRQSLGDFLAQPTAGGGSGGNRARHGHKQVPPRHAPGTPVGRSTSERNGSCSSNAPTFTSIDTSVDFPPMPTRPVGQNATADSAKATARRIKPTQLAEAESSCWLRGSSSSQLGGSAIAAAVSTSANGSAAAAAVQPQASQPQALPWGECEERGDGSFCASNDTGEKAAVAAADTDGRGNAARKASGRAAFEAIGSTCDSGRLRPRRVQAEEVREEEHHQQQAMHENITAVGREVTGCDSCRHSFGLNASSSFLSGDGNRRLLPNAVAAAEAARAAAGKLQPKPQQPGRREPAASRGCVPADVVTSLATDSLRASSATGVAVVPPPCPALVSYAAKLYGCILQGGLVPNVAAELLLLIQLILCRRLPSAAEKSATGCSTSGDVSSPPDASAASLQADGEAEDGGVGKHREDGNVKCSSVDQKSPGAADLDCSNSSSCSNSVKSDSVLLDSAENGIHFCVIALQAWPVGVMLLDGATLRLLAENERLKAYAPRFSQILLEKAVFAESVAARLSAADGGMRSGGWRAVGATRDLQWTLLPGPAGSGSSVLYQEESDGRACFPSDRSFQAFKKQRDVFYECLRDWQARRRDPTAVDASAMRGTADRNAFGDSRSTEFSLRDKARAIVAELRSAEDHSVAMIHMARLFRSQLLVTCLDSSGRLRTDDDATESGSSAPLNDLLLSNPAKYRRLLERLVTPSCAPAARVLPKALHRPTFNGHQEFFRDFIAHAACPAFNCHLADAMTQSIEELSKHWSSDVTAFRLQRHVEVTVDDERRADDVTSERERCEHFVTELAAARLLAKFLGFVMFLSPGLSATVSGTGDPLSDQLVAACARSWVGFTFDCDSRAWSSSTKELKKTGCCLAYHRWLAFDVVWLTEMFALIDPLSAAACNVRRILHRLAAILRAGCVAIRGSSSAAVVSSSGQTDRVAELPTSTCPVDGNGAVLGFVCRMHRLEQEAATLHMLIVLSIGRLCELPHAAAKELYSAFADTTCASYKAEDTADASCCPNCSSCEDFSAIGGPASIINHGLLYDHSVYLGTVRSLLASYSLGSQSQCNSATRKITPLSQADDPRRRPGAAEELLVTLEQSFFRIHHASVRQTVLFASEQLAANCVRLLVKPGGLLSDSVEQEAARLHQSFSAELRLQRQLGGGRSPSSSPAIANEVDLSEIICSTASELYSRLRAESCRSSTRFCSERARSIMSALLSDDTAPDVVSTAAAICCKLSCSKAQDLLQSKISVSTLEQMLSQRLCEAAKKDTIAPEAVDDDVAASASSSSKEVSCSSDAEDHDVNAPSPTETLTKLKDAALSMRLRPNTWTESQLTDLLCSIDACASRRGDVLLSVARNFAQLSVDLILATVQQRPDLAKAEGVQKAACRLWSANRIRCHAQAVLGSRWASLRSSASRVNDAAAAVRLLEDELSKCGLSVERS